MKNQIYVIALTLGLVPGIALAQNANPYPDRQQTDQDRGMQRQDREDQQRTDQDYDRGSRQGAGNLDRLLHDRYPNSNIAVNYQDNNTVVLTGTAANGRDRKDAEDFVRSQLGNARVVDQIQVTGYGPGQYPNGGYYPNGAYNPNGTYQNDRDHDGDRNSGYNQQRPDRDRTDRDQDNRVPQSDVDANRTDRDRDYARDNDKNHNHKDKDKKHKKDKDKDKDRDRTPDRDQQPH